jgi:hypothetical protein
MSQNKLEYLRQFISNFIRGPNSDALLNSLADQVQKLEDLSISVNDQLTISTASDVYLDKRLAELGITRPADLGMEDLAYRNMGIQINAAKQVIDAIHAVLTTFYGDEATRAWTLSTKAGNYDLAEGDELIIVTEDGLEHTLTMKSEFFQNIQDATPEEVADTITRFIRGMGYNGYAQAFLDVDTNLKYVRIFGSSKGPISMIQIAGGQVQTKLEFPQIRETELPTNDTVWEITRTAGSTHRFRWVSGSQPLLDKIFISDKVMIYGNQFASVGIQGTMAVTNVMPAQPAPDVAAGYFEISIPDLSTLTSSQPDQNPPPNTISNTYSFTITQSLFDDLKFFLSKKNTAYSQNRYSLAWEPKENLLRIYMPATTKVVHRDLVGASHLHLLYPAADFNGSFGSATVEDSKVQIVNDRTVRYRQKGYDNLAAGGTLTHGLNIFDIEYALRENGFTTVILTAPHDLTGVVDAYGAVISNDVISIAIDAPTDDFSNPFLGPYIIDPEASYTLTDQFATSRERILAGEAKRTLVIDGTLNTQTGNLLFGLGSDTQEGPVKFLSSQVASSSVAVPISSISQLGTTVTAITSNVHGLIPGQQVQITGTLNFNGAFTVDSTPSATSYTFTKTPAGTFFETAGFSTPIVGGAVSTLTIDPAYNFKYTHEIGTDISIISDARAYIPEVDGTDYSTYVTGTADGRLFAESLMQEITALGIKLEIIIIYPSDQGLGNEGLGADETDPPVSDEVYVWGN